MTDIYGPYEASFRDKADADLQYWNAARSEGPESPAAKDAQTAADVTSDAAEQALYREPDLDAQGQEELEAGQ